MRRSTAEALNSAWTAPAKSACLQEAVPASQLNGSHGEYTNEDDISVDPKKKTKKNKNTNKVSVVINNSPSGVSSVASKNVEDLVSAILLQDKPYVLPRYTGAPVAPHQYRWQKQLSLDDPALYKTGFIFSNDPENILQIGQEIQGQGTIKAGSYNSDPGVVSNWPNTFLFVDQTLLLNDGILKSSTFPGVGMHWSNSSKRFVPGAKYYPCKWGSTQPTKFHGVIYNTSGVSASIQARLSVISGGQISYTISVTVLIGNGGNTFDFDNHADFTDFCTEMQKPTTQGFALAFVLSSPIQMNYGATYGMDIGDVELENPFTWKRYSLWNLISDGAVAKAQYEKASRYNVTGNAVTLTNTSSNYVKGGSIYAARLPGNSQSSLGGTIDSMIRVISSQTHHVLRTPSLETGMHYSFTPEKIQDWLFERSPEESPYDGDPHNLPYCAAVIDATGVQAGAVPTFIITGVVSIEYLTVDPSNWIVNSPANSMIFDALLTGLAAQNCLSENPDHFANVRRLVKKIMTEDNMKIALRTMINAGVKVAPFVLSLL